MEEFIYESLKKKKNFEFPKVNLLHKIQKTDKSSKYFELLEVIQKGELNEFKKSFNKESLEKIGLNYENCLEKTILMRICLLFNTKTTITYDELSKEIGTEEIEKWVLRATSYNLVKVKLNQVEKNISIM
jgi:hypothetical protein